MDRLVLFVGNRLIMTDYWREPVLATLSHSNPEWVAFGSCRVALHLDSKIFSDVLGSEFFNAGRVVDGLGNMDFALRLALDRPSVKYVVLQTDDNIWEQNAEDVKKEIEDRRIWFSLLKPETKAQLLRDYNLQEPPIESGFWKYRSLGETLFKTIGKWVLKRPNDIKDGYRPRKGNQNIERDLEDPKVLSNIRKTFTPNEFSKKKLEEFILKALAKNVTPILLVSPMHRLRATDDVNKRQIEVVEEMARRYRIPLFTYLDNTNSYALNDQIWSDQGHFNVLGAELFSRQFAEDLKEYSAKTVAINREDRR